LETAEVDQGGCIPWDRAFALAQGDSGFDPGQPQWLQKANFMCQMKNARIAALFSFFEPRTGMLATRAPDGSAVVENALTEAGRGRIGALKLNGSEAASFVLVAIAPRLTDLACEPDRGWRTSTIGIYRGEALPRRQGSPGRSRPR